MLALASIQSAPAALQRFESVEPHMGTLVRVTVYTADATTAQAAFRTAFDRIAALDRTLSDYRKDSELNAVTRRAVGRAVPASADLFAVLEASQTLARETGGAFDITQGPVIRLWREARRSGRKPDDDAIREAGARSGFRKLHLDERRRTVTVDVAGMALDVGAIGKGFAASEAIAALGRAGVTRALVAISGDLAFGDAPPEQRGWHVAIHEGGPGVERIPRVLELTNAAVSTSGNTEQHLDVGGQRYSHVIDPSSGTGVTSDRLVTVIAPHGIDADGLDTAVSIVGAKKGLPLVESRRGAAALIVERTPDGVVVHTSKRFDAMVAAQQRR